jgi:predicted RND superfamily exporter protein
MNRSVYRNQSFSMILSCSLVLLALTWFFRNFWLALAASIPAGITLLVTFGVMGIYDIPMDVGTSMISSIALGVGIDYAVHLVWRYGVPTRDEENEALSDSLETTGWGIIINALEVTVGFGLLALGTVVPMRHFGLLTALAMVVSALCTLALIPLLMRGVRHWTERKTT